jgi:phosphatidate cytidylyltransferase
LDGSPPGGRPRPEQSGRSRVLLTRVLVGAALIPLVLVVNHLGGLVFAGFVALLAALGCREFYDMFDGVITTRSKLIGIVGSACLCLSFHFGSLEGACLLVTPLLAVILIESLVRQDRDSYGSAAGIGFMGLMYTGWLLGFFILLRNFGHGTGGAGLAEDGGPGRGYVLFVLILTWSYDSIAYVGGSFLGRHKLFARISPSKTVEGTCFGLAGCVAAALVSKVTFAGYLDWAQAIIVGVLLGIVAQIGDLVESMVKRSTRTKDSSNLIPGHGGVLDRFDSLLLTGPAFYLYIRAVAAWV